MATLMYLFLTFMILLASYAAKLYMKNRRFWYLVHKIQGDKCLPIIGNAHQIKANSVDIIKDMVRRWNLYNKSTYKIILGNAVFILLNNPENVEAVLNDNKELNKMQDYSYLAGWLGDGLLLATGNKWRKQRKVLTPAFHFKILEQFVDVFNNKGKIFIKKITEKKSKPFNIYPYITLYALDVITESVMGVNIDAQEKSESEYVRAVYTVCSIVYYRVFSLWKRSETLFSLSSDYRLQQKNIKILHDTSNRVIQSRKAQLKSEIDRRMSEAGLDISADDICGIKKKVAFLDLLLLSKTADGNPLPDESIREETDTFMFEGHDTTSSGISFTLYLLANNPHVQTKAFEEQRYILGDDLFKEPDYGDLQDMKYLELVIKESLRLYPPVPNFGRELMEDITLPDGTIIPGGCLVNIQAFNMHRNPKYYEDPEKFWPERFLPENIKFKHPYVFVPFSAGSRNCIGQKFAMMEMKSIVSKVLRNYILSSAGPGAEPILAAEIILKSKNGINLIINDREYY